MTLNADAVFKPTTGHYYRAPVGTVIAIADLLDPPTPWVEIGHTSIEDLLSITSEGGEATILGTLQAPALRKTYSARSETFAFTLQQFDEASLKLYFGSNATAAEGWLQVPSAPVGTEMAFLVVFEDGDSAFAFHAPKAEVLRGDDMAFEDTESLAGLPLSVTPLNYQSNAWPYQVTPLAAA